MATYTGLQQLKKAEELLFKKMLAELSCRQYQTSAEALPETFGISPSTLSRRFVQTSAKQLEKLLEREPVPDDDRSSKGFNLFSRADLNLFEVLARGEFNINGLQKKSLCRHIPEISSAAMSRILKRLHVHGLIRKVGRTYKYYLTRLGQAVITAGLAIRSFSVIPQLAHV